MLSPCPTQFGAALPASALCSDECQPGVSPVCICTFSQSCDKIVKESNLRSLFQLTVEGCTYRREEGTQWKGEAAGHMTSPSGSRLGGTGIQLAFVFPFEGILPARDGVSLTT